MSGRYGNVIIPSGERPWIIRTRLPNGTTARVLAVSRDGFGAVRRVESRYPGRSIIGCYTPESPELRAYDGEDGIR